MFSLNLLRLFWKYSFVVSNLQGKIFGYRSRKRTGCRRHPRWHVRRLTHQRHVRATETQRALNRSARDSDTRGFHGLSNGWRLCWLLLLQESTSHELRRDIRRYRHCSSRCSGSGVWPPERAPRCRRRFLLILREVGEKISRISVLIPPSSFVNLLREKRKKKPAKEKEQRILHFNL